MTKCKTLVALAFLICVYGCTKQPTFEEAENLYKQGRYVEAAAAYAPYAEQGDYRAQVYLGRHYIQKNSQDLIKAVGYFKKAADQGDSDAMYFLGMAYLSGEGVPQNLDIGEQYLTRSANTGSVKSLSRICSIYAEKAHKNGEMADAKTGLLWCERAYQAGSLSAGVEMQSIYGGAPINDYKKSVVWYAAYQLAANNYKDSVFDRIPSEQKLFVKAQAYAYYSEFGKNKSKITYLDSLYQKP
jgi:TPR repeat protein